ncbi:hypothetical protein [Crassaminicella indica]|uniref:DUF4129 domain-containing protein n=1 Tax=Crassaminicella indica TaxID=2855394 RepID=A0ABX8RDB4_9CLOT|nr:hypothetical protein [Crassaminicella indica]QXM06277.1 hypothetical protein KVH43_00070 [Crassaminicella indica]
MSLPRETFDKAVNKIIDSAKYMHLKEKQNILKEFFEKLLNLLDKVFTKENTHKSICTDTTQNAFIIIVILLIVVLIFYLIKQNKYTDIKKKVIYGETIDEETTYDSLYKKAIKCEEQENYKDAIRLYFIGILVMMNEKSLCFLDDSKTNDEMIKVLRGKGFSGVNLFKSIGDYFQYIWYGNKKIDSERFTMYKEQINNLFMEVKNYHEKA